MSKKMAPDVAIINIANGIFTGYSFHTFWEVSFQNTILAMKYFHKYIRSLPSYPIISS